MSNLASIIAACRCVKIRQCLKINTTGIHKSNRRKRSFFNYTALFFSLQAASTIGGLACWVLANSVFVKTVLVPNALIFDWLGIDPLPLYPRQTQPFSSVVNKN